MKKTGEKFLAVILAMTMILSLTIAGISVSAVSVLNAPANIRTQNSGTGFYIAWSKAAGAAKYRVYYKTAESGWEYKDTSTNSISLTDLEYGKLYYIQVQSIANNGTGKFAKVSSMTHVRGTVLRSAVYNSNGSVTLNWDKADGANGYAVAKIKANDNKYTYFYTDNTTLTYNDITAGTVYYFQIRPYYTNGKSAAYAPWSNTKSLTTLFKPTVTNINSTVENMNINWNKIGGVKSYQLAYKRSTDKAWNYRITTSNYYNVKTPTQGATYYIQVRAINDNLSSSWSEVAERITPVLGTPTITGINSTYEKMTANWSKVDDATGYEIAFKRTTDADTAWNIRQTASPSYIVNEPTPAATYTVKVRALYNAVKSNESAASTHKINPLGVPTISDINSTVEKLNINWSKADGAKSYDIAFRRTNIDAEGVWHHKTSTDTTITVDKPTQGVTYQVKVRAVRNNNYGDYSEISTNDIPVLGVPQNVDITSTIKWISINWNKADNATAYRIAIMHSTDKKWTYYTTTDTSYVYENPVKGATYYIQVQALCGAVAGTFTKVNTQIIPEKDPYEGLTYYEAGETVKVTHPAETELVWVVDEAAHDETKTEVKSAYHYRICQACGAVGDGWTAEEIKNHDWLVHGIEPGTSIRPFGKPKSGYVDEPVDTILHVSEKGHYEVKVIKEAWEEDVTIAQSGWYKTVTHPAETAQAKAIDKAAYYYEEPVYEYVYKHLCWGCDADVGADVMTDKERSDHATMHHNKGEISGYRYVKLKIQSGVNTINNPEVCHYDTVVVKDIWSELIFVMG